MTKKELDAWHADHSNFLNMKIDVNGSDVSDMILYQRHTRKYHNTRTGKSAYDIMPVVEKGRRFIIVFDALLCSKGIYIKYDKEHDILIAVLVKGEARLGDEPSFEWIEEYRMFVSLNYEGYGSFTMNGCVDICGQTPFSQESSIDLIVTAGAEKEIMSYLKGHIFTVNEDDEYDGFLNSGDYDYFSDVFKAVADGFKNKQRIVGGITQAGKTVEKLEKPYPIPAEVEKFFNEILVRRVNDIVADINYNGEYTFSFVDVCIVQNIDGKMVKRCFCADVILNGIVDNAEKHMVEYLDIVLDDTEEIPKSLRRWFGSVPIWIDENTKGTMLEHTSWLIKNGIGCVKRAMDEYDTWSDVDIIADNEFSDVYRTGCCLNYIVELAAAAGGNPIFEKLYKISFNEKLPDLRFKVSLSTNLHTCSAKEIITDLFGRVDYNASKLHEALMLPKGMLEYVGLVDYIKKIHFAKYPFEGSDESLNFFRRMDDESWKTVADLFIKRRFFLSYKVISNTLRSMINLFGVQSWKSYINHMLSLELEDWEGCEAVIDGYGNVYDEKGYALYIKLLEVIGPDAAKNADWKLSGEALKKSLSSAMKVVSSMNKEHLKEAFETLNKKGRRWLFENETYKIVVPKSAEEVVNEGMTLNHCAKEFIPKIIDGETELLFIRRQEKLDKPYYTLEVRNGRIRQCHGKDNADVETESLKDFLKEFCENKNIALNYGEAMMRP